MLQILDSSSAPIILIEDDLRESVLAAFGKYMSDAAEVIRVMKKLRSLAELQLLVDSFSER